MGSSSHQKTTRPKRERTRPHAISSRNNRSKKKTRARIAVVIQRGAIVLLGVLLAEVWTRDIPATHDPLVKIRNYARSSADTSRQDASAATAATATTATDSLNNDYLFVSPELVFSTSYHEARTKFRTAVQSLDDGYGAELHSLEVYRSNDTSSRSSGKQDDSTIHDDNDDTDAYTMDICVIRGQQPGMVVHTSGYHGVEGYAGSAIQVAWLLLLQQQQQKQEDDTSSSSALRALERLPTVILVHVVNPYGMATFRRTDQNNVDLNRNGLHPDEWPLALENHANNDYHDFDATLFNPKRPPSWLIDWYACRMHVMAIVAILQHGLSNLKRAMVSGQYHAPQGIFYGGSQLEPSLHLLWDFLTEQQAIVSKQSGKRKGKRTTSTPVMTMINIHTGLGPSGEDSMLTSSSIGASSERGGISPQALHETFCNSSIPSLSQAANDVAGGYELTMGTAEDFFSRLCRPTKKSLSTSFKSKKDDDDHDHDSSCWIVTQEFGTIPMPLVGIALILENMARHYITSPEEQLEWAKLTTGRAFYKQRPKWRKDVLVKGVRVLEQAIHRTITQYSS